MKRNRGFTLMEMLIVVAIIAVLAAIAIPVFNGSLHKAKVAADMANVRAYYAELQLSGMLTGDYVDVGHEPNDFHDEITFPDNTVIKLQAGWVSAILIREPPSKPASSGQKGAPIGYQVYYICDKGDHELLLE